MPPLYRVRTQLSICLLLFACLPCTAWSAPAVALHASFRPERLGHYTALEFSAQISPQSGVVPPPLTDLEVRYPRDLGVAVGELGLETCAEATLEALGPGGCPADSRMGDGSALAEIPVASGVLKESATVAVVRAPESGSNFALLLYASAISPIYAQIAFPGLLLGATALNGGGIRIGIPLVPGLPGGPDVALVSLRSTIGGTNLTYYEHAHGKPIAYKPRGLLLPNKCPTGGFAFNANFAFLDGSRASAQTRVPCPPEPRPR